MNTLNFDEKYELNKDLKIFEGPGFLRIEEHDSAQWLLNSFEFFYYINGRFPRTDSRLLLPDDEKSSEGQGDGLNLMKLYGKFSKTKPHTLVSIPFLCSLDLFLGGN